MKKFLFIAIILSVAFSVSPAFTQPELRPILRAQGEELSTAIGHYARSRALLLEAIREFDAGLKHANPQVLIDVKEFRNSLIDRTEDLEKVLAPQPKANESGVQFRPNSRLLSDAYK